jgi:hypothetical protein
MRLTWLRGSRYRVAQQPEEVQPVQGVVLLPQGAPRGALARAQAKLREGYTADGHSSERAQVRGTGLQSLEQREWVCDATQVLEDQEVSAQGDGQSCTCLGEEKSDTRVIIALYLCFLLHLMHLSHNVSNVTESVPQVVEVEQSRTFAFL